MSAGGWSTVAEGSPGRALLLAEEEGLAIAGLVDEVLAALPGLKPARAYAVADTLGRGETAFSDFHGPAARGRSPRPCATWCAGGPTRSSRDWLRCGPLMPGATCGTR